MESVIFSRALPKEENKKIATRLCNVVMNKEFLNGEYVPILEKKIKKEELKTTKEVKNKSLVDLIEKEYLRENFQPGVHNKTKARDVFNKLCNDKFLKGSFDTFCKEQYENVVKKECPYNSAPAFCKKWTLVEVSSTNHASIYCVKLSVWESTDATVFFVLQIK